MVETDASDYALAAVLSIRTPDGDYHLVAFHSWTFKDAETNYDVHDKELTAIYDAFKRWQHHLEGAGTPIDVVTDHRNLQYFSTTKVLTRQQARCSETFPSSTWLSVSDPGNSAPNPMRSRAVGTFTQKRGVATMPVLTHRTFGRCSLTSNWHHPFVHLPSGYQPSEVH